MKSLIRWFSIVFCLKPTEVGDGDKFTLSVQKVSKTLNVNN